MTAPATTDPLYRQLQAALFPDYALDRELGRGGMGAVYLGRDLRLDRPVAIKLLPPELAAQPELRERFLRETKTAAAFSHPNIVPVHSVEDREDTLCFVMGYVDGQTLADRVRRVGPLATGDAVRLLQEMAWALSYAHGRGVVHRDIKPDNILLERSTGRALITDFGISRSLSAPGLTTVGQLIGTPQFMSPEQASGEPADGRSDLYSLGVVGFYALTGRPPFEADSVQGYLAMHVTRSPVPVASLRPDIPTVLSGAIDRLLAKDPNARFQTGEELADALDALRVARPVVPAAIRLFRSRTTQLARGGIAILLFAPFLASSMDGSADRLIVLIMLLAGATGIAMQGVASARDLAVQGLSYDDLRRWLGVIAAEETEARAQLMSSPRWRSARTRSRRRALLMWVGSAVLIAFSLTQRTRVAPDQYRTTLPGIVAIVAGVGAAMLGFVTMLASSGAARRLDRVILGVWSGPIGRHLFELATRGGTADGDAARGTTVGERGALTIYRELPKDVRRTLSGVTARVTQLNEEYDALRVREERIESAIAEARRGTASIGEAGAEARARVVAELVESKDAIAERRSTIVEDLERLRLELLRVASGVGDAAILARQLTEAAGASG